MDEATKSWQEFLVMEIRELRTDIKILRDEMSQLKGAGKIMAWVYGAIGGLVMSFLANWRANKF